MNKICTCNNSICCDVTGKHKMFPGDVTGKHKIPWETLFMYMNGKHWNINAGHVVLIEQRDWSVSYAHVTNLFILYLNQKLHYMAINKKIFEELSKNEKCEHIKHN